MRPMNKPQSNFRARDGEENGTRTYQLILNSMQVLPVADISKITLLDKNSSSSSKGKRKAREDAGVPPEKKKMGTRSKRSGKDAEAMDIA
jgi:hypothetical protein